jgi:hypothetical protein
MRRGSARVTQDRFSVPSSDPTRPSEPTVKRLFALSGNRCAFPKCSATLIDGSTVVGKICHIKGARPGSARYDEQQSAVDRHSFENLILMCGRHHDVIDDDEEAYTPDRLLKMKADHEARAASIDDAFAERAAHLLIDQPVRSENQSGGITAHTVHLNVSGLHSEPEQEKQRHAAKLQRQSEARRYLAPELNRTIARVLYIHDRACANFVCASAEHSIKPNDRKEDFIPHWPVLYPNAPQCQDLAADDAASLIAYYDSLHSLADSVNEWWERDGQLPVNIFNVFLHLADKSLELGLICIEKFEVEKLCPLPYEAWGTISSRIERSRASAANARKHHIARFEAKNKTPPPPMQRPNRR